MVMVAAVLIFLAALAVAGAFSCSRIRTDRHFMLLVRPQRIELCSKPFIGRHPTTSEMRRSVFDLSQDAPDRGRQFLAPFPGVQVGHRDHRVGYLREPSGYLHAPLH